MKYDIALAFTRFLAIEANSEKEALTKAQQQTHEIRKPGTMLLIAAVLNEETDAQRRVYNAKKKPSTPRRNTRHRSLRTTRVL